MTTPVQDPARVARRRREHERQAVVYGVLVALLLLVGLAALAVYSGAIEAPFARGFTSTETPEDAVTPPCLPAVEGQPDGALPLAYSEVHLRILNASNLTGIARAYETVLSGRGFAVDSVGNYTSVLTYNELRFGGQGIVAAYTLAAQFPEMRMVLDAREDATIDLLVGKKYEKPLNEDYVTIAADTPLTNAPGCKPAENLTPRPAPTPTAPAPEEEQPAPEG
ncbi:LytR family transcriptional regulator [Xylanimonas allomyrinae]|uniref:LytR family transcriptional regulator n=1 Tax=Xylanimonas allomyrinae TaxID=2509459 RepID=A0A4P6EQQ9_9MICO|nr:LytR C-terminal domain-containing protein [Xylanimonas allomyrinae]QAY64193.1 LytR family transcriptional regulator [Xylanimonas allomyrinae]